MGLMWRERGRYLATLSSHVAAQGKRWSRGLLKPGTADWPGLVFTPFIARISARAGLGVEAAGDLQLMNPSGALGIIAPGADRQAALQRQQGHLEHAPAGIIIQVLEDMEARAALLIILFP